MTGDLRNKPPEVGERKEGYLDETPDISLVRGEKGGAKRATLGKKEK